MQRHVPARFPAAVLALAFALPALAADPPQAVAPPPPGMDEPGVAPAPPTESSVPTPRKPELVRSEPRDANGEPPSDVSVRKNGEETVEEYRRSGKLYMIRILPKSGIAQTFMADNEGRLTRDPKAGPISPVYYTLYQWK